jgi:hypothetical protein
VMTDGMTSNANQALSGANRSQVSSIVIQSGRRRLLFLDRTQANSHLP